MVDSVSSSVVTMALISLVGFSILTFAVTSLGEQKDWMPPIVGTTATNGDGFDFLWKEIKNHKKYLGTDRKAEMRLKRINYELENQVSQKLFTKKMVQIGTNEISKMSKKILERKIDPLTAVEKIIRE